MDSAIGILFSIIGFDQLRIVIRAIDHFIKDTTERPHVSGLIIVTFVENYLRASVPA